ncbi:MAG: hypothetical protein KAJ17_11910, partial [Candidatus Krumholzibacteria bacterium]|nr:hypothetical protein [Candidatus Krumholzibacteria bacterium]
LPYSQPMWHLTSTPIIDYTTLRTLAGPKRSTFNQMMKAYFKHTFNGDWGTCRWWWHTARHGIVGFCMTTRKT